MNKYNVIDRIDTLSDLENDMFEWSRLPMKFKHMSDDECKRQHGMTNLQYYEMVKNKLLNNDQLYDVIDDSIREEYNIFDREAENQKAHEERLSYSLELQQSPYIVILDIEDIADGDINSLLNKYQSYITLPTKYRRWSDYYSYNIYNLTVPDMYKALSAKLTGNSDDEKYDDIDDIDAIRYYIRTSINKSYCENNMIDLLTYKSLDYVSIDENYIGDKYIEDNYDLDFDTVFNKITPYFTPDEYNKLAENYLIEDLDYREWKDALRSAIKENDEQKIIDLGWNPSIIFNEKTQEYARERQISWFKDNAPRVVDIQNIDNQVIFTQPFSEDTKYMNDLYTEKDLFPVYIVMSYSDTLFGNVERFIKKVEYTHAGLCFDNSLSEIFTFSFGKDWNGFVTDSLDIYIKNSSKAIMSIICIFVDKDTRDKMYTTINYLQDHKERTKYGFGNIVNILLNRAKKFPYPENLAMVCSQFVDMMLKLVNIDITHKSSNLVIPEDFKRACNSRFYIYKVYEGLCTRYNPNKVEQLIKMLFYRNKIENIKYPHTPLPINFVSESDELAYHGILEDLKEILTPRNILETNVRVSKDGYVEVDLYDYLKDQCKEIHNLLISYDESNIEGMKKEIAHLFYINTIIEDVIRKKKKHDDEYESFVVLRGLVILEFKKYYKEVLKIDKEFSFADYYQNSEYNVEVKDLANTKMKYSGKDIKKVLRAIENFKK